MTNPFAGMSGVSVSGSMPYFLPGKYRVKITGCKTIQSQKNKAQTLAIIETLIVESNVPERPAGSHASQVINLGQTMGPINVKAFLAAAFGVEIDPAATLTERIEAAAAAVFDRKIGIDDLAGYVFSDANPLGEAEAELALECVEITTKAERKPFTKHIWFPAA